MAPVFTLKVLAVALLATASSGAMAQYAWLDAKGVKQYSDMPPPPGTPANRVLRDAVAHPVSPSAAQESPAASSLAERNAAFQKRRMEQAERERKESEQARLDADRARNCDQARAYSRALASGERISRVDQNGEYNYLSDAERAQETAATQRIMEQCKQGS
jgi:hypothetical protein